MASCLLYLSSLLNPTDFAAALNSLPFGDGLYTSAICDLSPETQHHLKLILSQHASNLPDRIKQELQLYCTCQKPTGILAFLNFTERNGHIAYATAGALAITVLGYVTVQYVVRYMEKLRRAERALYAKQLGEVCKSLGASIAHVDAQFTASLQAKVKQLEKQLRTNGETAELRRAELRKQVELLQQQKTATDERVTKLEELDGEIGAKMEQVKREKKKVAENVKSANESIQRILKLAEGFAEEREGLVKREELEDAVKGLVGKKHLERVEGSLHAVEGVEGGVVGLESKDKALSLKRIRAWLEELEEAQDKMKKALKLTTGASNDAKTQIEGVQEKQRSVDNTLTELIAKLGVVRSEQNTAKDGLESIRSTAEAVEKDQDEAKKKAAETKSKLAFLESYQHFLMGEMTELKFQVASVQLEHATLKQTAADILELEASHEIVANQENRLDNLESKQTTMLSQLVGIQAVYGPSQGRLTDIQKQHCVELIESVLQERASQHIQQNTAEIAEVNHSPQRLQEIIDPAYEDAKEDDSAMQTRSELQHANQVLSKQSCESIETLDGDV